MQQFDTWLPKGTYIFISRPLVWHPELKQYVFATRKGLTYRAGKRKLKRALWAAKQAAKKERRALKKARLTAGIQTQTLP